MKNQTKIIMGTGLVLVAIAILSVVGIASPRIIGRAVAPEGVELCVLQRFNWFDDPFFTTSFVFQKPGQPWKWFYYNHEDDYWGRARMALDTNLHQLVVYGKGSPTIRFEWEPELYSARGGGMRDNPSAKPASWSPAAAGYR